MIAFFKLVRLPNLLIIALTQYLVRWCIIYPLAIVYFNAEFEIKEFDFFLLSLSTVLIAAAGYAINDYFDIRIDQVNRPGKIIAGVKIKRRVVMGAHVVMNALALALAVYVSHKYGNIKLALIHFTAAVALWFYSTNLKRQLIIGNIIIAALAAMVPFTVIVYELPLLAENAVSNQMLNNLFSINYIVLGYTVFAFLATLIREIIKDAEDVAGDREYGRSTIPVVYGYATTKIIVYVLSLVVMVALAYIQYMQWAESFYLPFLYIGLFIQLPFVIMLYVLYKAGQPGQYRLAGNLAKAIIVTGILSMAVFYYTL